MAILAIPAESLIIQSGEAGGGADFWQICQKFYLLFIPN